MKKILFIFMALIVLTILGCSSQDAADKIQNLTDKNNENVLMVKNGHPEIYPDSKYGESFDNFFGSPTWVYFKSEDGQDVVEFTGDCTYQEVKVKARIQFILDVHARTFTAGALSFNDVPQNQLMTTGLFSKVFEYAEQETTSSLESENTNVNADNNASTEEEFYGEWVISKVAKSGKVSAYGNDEINKKIIGHQLIFSKEKSSCFGDDISYLNKVVNNPIYKKVAISNSDFEMYYRTTLNSFEIKSDSVINIDVTDLNDNIKCTFFIKDNNTLILFGGGTFFELNRK